MSPVARRVPMAVCQCQDRRVTYQAGDRVEYIAAPVFDLIIQPGDVGEVTRVDDGWVYAIWPRSGEHSVPLEHVRPARRPYVLERHAHAADQRARPDAIIFRRAGCGIARRRIPGRFDRTGDAGADYNLGHE